MDLFGAGAALHWLASPGHISSAHRSGKHGARVGMNVITHQEKEKNEETKKGRRKEKVKTGHWFWRRYVLPYCGRLGGSIAKKWRGVPGVTGILGKANSHFDPTQTGLGTAPPRWGGCWLVQRTARRLNLCWYMVALFEEASLENRMMIVYERCAYSRVRGFKKFSCWLRHEFKLTKFGLAKKALCFGFINRRGKDNVCIIWWKSGQPSFAE